jgi:hypothetical protein
MTADPPSSICCCRYLSYANTVTSALVVYEMASG